MYKIIQAFPNSNSINDRSYFNIYRAVLNKIFNVIPPSLFKTKIIDFKDNQKNVFSYENGSFVNKKEARRIQMPSFQIEFEDNGINTQDTVNIQQSAPYTQYSIAEGVNPEMRGYVPIYKDRNNIQIFSSEVYINCKFNITMSVQTLDDRNNLHRILRTCIKQNYGYQLNNIISQYLLPNSMVNYLREALYSKEIDILKANQNELDNQILKNQAEKIDKDFINYINNEGNGVISCVKFSMFDKSPDILVSYNRPTEVFFKMDSEFSVSEGEKRGELYDKYNITGNGYIEFYTPINFILNLPSIIKGEWIKPYQVLSKIPDKNTGKLPIQFFEQIYVESRNKEKEKVFLEKWDEKVYQDLEFICDNGYDEYPILLKILEISKNEIDHGVIGFQFFKTYNKKPNSMEEISKLFLAHLKYTEQNRYTYIDKVLFVLPYLSEKEFKEIFKIFVYENEDLLSENDYNLSKDLSLKLKNTSDKKVYSFQLYADKRKIQIKFDNLSIYNY